ncbi:MAG: HlyD family efflux transporter periplasmic adaptor subunit [Pseudomonadales bacterium]|nr:HlyD family efflux transporter periplasmic adaptor subunit [Pseudomonadales bacterium]MCP5215185.1 HlyD family efflux transporter periplasmic adaptor subunit [Pseudomonadales bacterium]
MILIAINDDQPVDLWSLRISGLVSKYRNEWSCHTGYNGHFKQCPHLEAQRNNLYLIASVDGLVVARDADPGTTVVAGQSVVELIDPNTLWINVRFDQIHAQGLATNLSARIVLRSRTGASQAGHILRVEPLADAVTEEILAKVTFDQLPDPLPPVGELAEVTIELPALSSGPVVPNAAIQRRNGKLGVWLVTESKLRFTPVIIGTSDLIGQVQIREGLNADNQVVAYSEKALNTRSRIHVVERFAGSAAP